MVDPRVCWTPPAVSSRGREALELAVELGITLDDWQAFVLERSLAVGDAERWAAFEVGVNVARQNGKNAILEVRELAGVLCFGERLVIHSAHLADTSREGFARLENLIDANAWLSAKVRHIWRTNGHEAIEFTDGARIRFRTRTKGGGRGFSADCVIFDEAMVLMEASLAAILPVVSAKENPQVWYTGSAVDQEIHDYGLAFSRVRSRGVKGGDPRLAYFEWSVDYATPDKVPVQALEDPRVWQQANPALGIRISEENVQAERRAMSRRTFAVERLGVGDWPDPDATRQTVIPLDDWNKLTDAKSALRDPIVLSFDVKPDRARSCIAAAGHRRDGLFHVEIVDDRAGTDWVAERLAGLVERHEVSHVVCDAVSPAASLVPDVEQQGMKVTMLNTSEYAQACGRIVDAVASRGLRHLGTGELVEAIDGAVTRPLGDAWAWSRKRSSGVNIAPLVAVTVALFVADTEGASVYNDRGVLVV